MEEISIERGYYSLSGFVARVINGVFALIEAMLVLRLVLELLGANAGSAFIAWVYGITDPLVAPFVGAFPALSVGAYGAELSTLVAMVGFAIIAWLVGLLLSFIFNSF